MHACPDQETGTVRLFQGAHGTFHLTVGPTTLHLMPEELMMVRQAINQWGLKEPTRFQALIDHLHEHGLA